MARYLSTLQYDLILVARNNEKLQQLKQELEEKNKTKVDILLADLAEEKQCIALYKKVKKTYQNIDVLINNAGFGLFGKFTQTDLNRELEMINTNIKAVHILTKLFLIDMQEQNKGNILNVASVAGFMPGPLMATYYATKNYIFRLSQAIHKELKKQHSQVHISVLCPGPVATNFNQVANVKFNLKQLPSEKVAKYAIDKMRKNQFKIIPGLTIKLARIASKVMPDNLVAECCYYAQRKKEKSSQ